MTEVPAVATAVRIIDRLADKWPDPVATGVLVEELSLNRSTCYNILATLQRAGWVVTFGNRAGWSLGPRLLALTGAPEMSVNAILQEELDTLSRRVRLSTFVAQRERPGNYIVLAKADRASGIRVTVGVGDTFEFSAPALMLACSAWESDEEFARLAQRHGIVQFTERTVVDLDSLRALRAEVRARGYSTSIQQMDLSQGAVAAPIFDSRGRSTRSVCCLGFYTDLHETNVNEIGAEVAACAERITLRTGGRPPLTPPSVPEPLTA